MLRTSAIVLDYLLFALASMVVAEVLITCWDSKYHYVILLREEFFPEGKAPLPSTQGQRSHERTRQLLATAKSNWAQDLIAEREDRL